jgi:hypothetical protein
MYMTVCNPNSRNATGMNREGLSVKVKVTFTLGTPNSCYTPNPSFPPSFDEPHQYKVLQYPRGEENFHLAVYLMKRNCLSGTL